MGRSGEEESKANNNRLSAAHRCLPLWQGRCFHLHPANLLVTFPSIRCSLLGESLGSRLAMPLLFVLIFGPSPGIDASIVTVSVVRI